LAHRAPGPRPRHSRRPAWFAAVGQFYRDFTQVEDDEVVEMLRKAKETP
jgi:predicted phosphoribosyltransferase